MAGERDVERELAEALREIRDDQQRGFAKLESRLDSIQRDAQQHYQNDAALFAELKGKASGAYHKAVEANERIEQHIEDHARERTGVRDAARQGWIALWVGIVISGITGAVGLILSIFKKGGTP